MRVGHDESVIADAGDAAAFFSASTDGDGFADDVVVADLEADVLSFKGDVLWFEAESGKRKDAVVLADLCGAMNHDVGNEFAVFSEFNIGADHAIRADGAGGGDLGC